MPISIITYMLFSGYKTTFKYPTYPAPAMEKPIGAASSNGEKGTVEWQSEKSTVGHLMKLILDKSKNGQDNVNPIRSVSYEEINELIEYCASHPNCKKTLEEVKADLERGK